MYLFITLDLLSGFSLILHNKRGQEVHGNFISRFLRKNLIWGNLIFLGHFLLFDWVWSKLSQATATIGSLNSQDMILFIITTGSSNSQDMIRIAKRSGYDFSSRRLCCNCCMDIVWYLCEEVNIQQSGVWLSEKASIRTCNIILLECKSP